MRSWIFNVSMNLKNTKAKFAFLFVLRARILDYIIYFQREPSLKAIDVGGKKSENPAARAVRPPEEGLLLLYPISRNSGRGRDRAEGGNRRPLYDDPNDPRAHDLVGVAISFPKSTQPQPVEAYLQGTVDWRPIE